MPKKFAGSITSQYKPSSFYDMSKLLYSKLLYFSQTGFKNAVMVKRSNKSIYHPRPIKHFLYHLKYEFFIQYFLRENRYFEQPVENEIYVYMPLHLIPESTTFVKAPFYINELNIIEQVSKSLPVGWKLYVKEHQSMLGERKLSFYKNVKKIPNVKLVQINYYKDPKPWILKSRGVIAITGSGAYEAAMLGKQSIIFGDVPFSLINGVNRVRSFEDLPAILSKLNNIENIHSCAAYIKTIKNLGQSIKIRFLVSEGELIVKGLSNISDEYRNEIAKLLKLYEQAYCYHKNQ